MLSKPQSGIEVKEAGDDSRSTGFNSKNRDERKGQSSVCMELLQISFDEGGIGGEDARLAVDCSSFESPVMAAGSVRLRRKTKGNFRICGVLSLLGKIKCKLDWVFARPALKPNRKRKWVRVLGLSNSSGGWVPGLDLQSISVLSAILGRDSGQGPKSLLGLFLEPNLGEAPPLVLSKGTFMGYEDGLEVPSSSIVGVVPSSYSGVLVSSVSAHSSSVYVRESTAEGFNVGVKVSGDLPAKGFTPTGDGFSDDNGSDDVASTPVPISPFPSAEDFPAGFLSRD